MTETQTPNVLLYSLNGSPAPADLGQGLSACLELPADVAPKIADVVFACLEPVSPDQLRNRIGRHCRRLELDEEIVSRTVLAARFLLHAAAETNASPEDVGKDLSALGCGAVAEWLVPLYAHVVGELRRDIARSALTMHGRVLTQIDWRMDTVGSTNRGRELNLAVAMVTLHYIDGKEEGRMTVQMLPDMVNEMRRVCDQLLT
jgi:hypothetical protein